MQKIVYVKREALLPLEAMERRKEGICQERIAAKRRLVRFRRFCASPVVVIVVGEEEGNQEMWLASPIRRLARHSYTLPSNFSPGGNVGAGRRQEGKIGRNEVRKEADARFTSVNNRSEGVVVCFCDIFDDFSDEGRAK